METTNEIVKQVPIKTHVPFRGFDWVSLILTLPFIALLTLLIVLPVLLTVRNAFTSATYIGLPGNFVGLQQFGRVLSDGLFWDSLGRSLIWVFGNAILQTVLAFFFALIVNQRIRGGSTIQILVMLPWIIPTVAVAVVGTWLMNSSYGVVNYALVQSGIIQSPLNAYGNPRIALISLIVLNSWHWFPFFFTVILGALKTVPEEIYEAAAIDGANSFQRFKNVTFPLISRILGIVGLVGTLWSFNVFDTIYLITRGGPANSTFTAPIYVYETAFRQFQLGKSAAASVILVIILILFAVLYYNFVVRKGYSNT
jgi:multiple sugar transport system permease protein